MTLRVQSEVNDSEDLIAERVTNIVFAATLMSPTAPAPAGKKIEVSRRRYKAPSVEGGIGP
jgi:hypothetical protein